MSGDGSEFQSNDTGYVVSSADSTVVMITFFAFYVVSLFFFFLILILVTWPILEWYGNKPDPKPHPHFFLSTVITAWILIFAHALSCIPLTVVGFLNDIYHTGTIFLHNWRHIFSPDITVYNYIIIIFHDLVILAIISSFLLAGIVKLVCYVCKEMKGSCALFDKISAYRFSVVSLFLYALIMLWQIVPLMCHMIMYPLLTLCIIFQYLGSLFLLHLLMYQITKSIASCRDKDRIQAGVHAFLALVAFSGFVLVLITGFLYFTVTFVGVSTTGMTMFAIGIITAITTATIGGALRDVIKERVGNPLYRELPTQPEP